jgi:3'(2'), 5'-bisphosphate nucleotidase
MLFESRLKTASRFVQKDDNGMSATHDALSAAWLADALLPVALAAGRIQMGYFRAGAAVQTKADTTPVTVADQESEALILAALAQLAPGVPVIAEEAMAAGQMPDIGDTFFLVDPLDGTREFIAGRGEFTVNIALVRGTLPVFGLVYAPVTHELFVTTGPATAVRATVAPEAAAATLAGLGVNTIRVRRADPERVVVMASRSHMTPETEAFLSRFKVAERRAAGSSLKFCLVAAGEADLYPRAGRTSEWDTAAGQAVLAAAGGKVTTFDGEVLRYGKAAERFRNPDYVAWGGW